MVLNLESNRITPKGIRVRAYSCVTPTQLKRVYIDLMFCILPPQFIMKAIGENKKTSIKELRMANQVPSVCVCCD